MTPAEVTEASDSTTTTVEATTTTASTTTLEPTTTTEPATTTSTRPPVTELVAGLYCRDLEARGYSYSDAVTYWTREGRPDRMDADFDAIPCETVYDADQVVAFWGDPLPTSTTVPAFSVAALEDRLAAEFPFSEAGTMWDPPKAWTCSFEFGSGWAGSVLSCVPAAIGEGQYPVLTVVVLDNVGSYAASQSGVVYTILNAEFIQSELGSRLYCRDVLAEDSRLVQELPTVSLEYFGAVLYWFMEGRPDRMDADRNGLPCETLVPAAVVNSVWDGGWIEG